MMNSIYLRLSTTGELRLLFPQAPRLILELEEKVMESLAPQLTTHGVYRFDLVNNEGDSEIHQNRLADGDDPVVLLHGCFHSRGEVELGQVWLDLTGDDAEQEKQEEYLAQAVVEKLFQMPHDQWHWILLNLSSTTPPTAETTT